MFAATTLLALSVLVSAAAPAAAHAVLVDSSPRDGARLEQPPDQVWLQFDEPVQVAPDSVQVINSDGEPMTAGAPRSADDGRRVIIDLANLPEEPASYLLSWQVTSVDSHPVVGSLRFGVRQQPTLSAATTTEHDQPGGALRSVGASLTHAGSVLAVGCLAVALLVWPGARRSPRLSVLIIVGTAVAVVGTVAEAIVGALITPVSGVQQLGPAFIQLLRTLPGQLLLARALLLVLLAPLSLALLARPLTRLRLAGWTAVAVALLLVTAAHGHALASSDPVISVLATTAHLAGMCCWIGGVVVLLVIIAPRLRAHPGALGRAVAPWSRFAFGCVAVLILSGELLAWQQIQPVEGLWQTRFGIILLIKLALVALALVAGRTTARLLRRVRPLRQTRLLLAAEVVVGSMIIIAAGLLSATPAATDTYGPSTTVVADLDPGRLIVDVDSTRRGAQQITVRPQLPERGADQPAELTGRLSSDAAGVSKLEVHFVRSGDDWRSTDAYVPTPGTWTLELTARPDSGPARVTSVDYRVW